ncbi:MAG: aminotransferase class III-fold pyridoxal phosphate-dependent enzyme [Planctomycetota bacterium]|nr:aminotransferase class III-fold pyridoxal phosphate-dependent enzyme [Planctomycetota bacterium]
MVRTVRQSWALYREAAKHLACGSSTLSKAPQIEDAEPAAIVRGRGCRVWDADGNEYIDFRNGLGPVTLGYGVPEIDRAITEQLGSGIVFGHPHPLEGEVARMLTEVIPCAQRVRFLKTGGEAVAACIKIARHSTGRELIVQCGYNGWLNNLGTGGPRPVGLVDSQAERGFPEGLRRCHLRLPWGNLPAWEETFAGHGRQIAAAVVACDYAEMERGREFLPAVRTLTRQHGTLLIMDEIVTGFRLAIGGAHEYFHFDPDMAVLAKGIANGMPLSAYVGRAELLESAKELGISSTYGGETLSLAAARAAITLYRDKQVIAHLWRAGRQFMEGTNQLFRRQGLAAELRGVPVCPAFSFASAGLATEFFGACYRHGVSLYTVPYVNWSHTDGDIAEALERIEAATKNLASSATRPS